MSGRILILLACLIIVGCSTTGELPILPDIEATIIAARLSPAPTPTPIDLQSLVSAVSSAVLATIQSDGYLPLGTSKSVAVSLT